MATDKWANPKAMWDDRFTQAEPIFGSKPNAFLEAQVARLEPGMKVLVPGDGYGRNGIWLAQHGFQVRTVDLSPVGVERARKAANAAGVSLTIEQGDLETWNWPVGEFDAFDAVAAIFLHLPPELRRKAHPSMLRSLKPGGIVILEAFTPAQLKFSSGGPKQIELLYTPDLLREDFAAAEILELAEEQVQLKEGHKHSGPGAVVRGVFRAR
jgi:SAM-dependent methyltransferase